MDGRETAMRKSVLILLLTAVTMAVAVACGGDDEEGGAASGTPQATTSGSTATPRATTSAATATPRAVTGTAVATATPAGEETSEIVFNAASATINVDGDESDWADIEGAEFDIEQIEVPPGSDIEFDAVAPKDTTLKVASDGTNVYVLVEVDDTYDYVADDHNLSASMAVMFRIDDPAPPHMGVEKSDFDTSLGMVDIWHWELDCGPAEISGGRGAAGGDDPTCNLDDEYATTPEQREDDGGGDIANPDAENGLTGAWTHTAAAPGGEGKWVFEMSRPLSTGDPQDAQLTGGGTAHIAIAYWDPKESTTGWSDAGHLQSAELGWIEVTLP